MDQDQKDYQDYIQYLEYQASQGQEASPEKPVTDPGSMGGRVEALMGPKAAGMMNQMTSPESVQKAATGILPGMGKATSVLGKLAQSALQGGTAAIAMDSPDASTEDKLKDLLTGGVLGGALSGVTQGISAIPQAGKWVGRNLARMTKPQSEQYMQDPKGIGQLASQLQDQAQAPAVQDQAAAAINASRKSLRAKGLGKARNLWELLAGKQVNVNPDELLGGNPELDQVLNEKIRQGSGMYGNIRPETVALEANEANAFKRQLQESAKYRPGSVQDPVQEARNAANQARASKLRAALESTGGDGVKALNQEMQEGAIVSQALRQGLKSPISFVSSEAPDRIATMARASSPGDGGLLDFGNKLGAAKTMLAKDTGSGIPTFTGKLAGRTLMRASEAVTPATESLDSPAALQSLLNTLTQKRK